MRKNILIWGNMNIKDIKVMEGNNPEEVYKTIEKYLELLPERFHKESQGDPVKKRQNTIKGSETVKWK